MYRQTSRAQETIPVNGPSVIGKACTRLAWAAALLSLCGCASGRTGGSAEMRRALDDYHAHRYDEARGRAEALRKGGGPLAADAAYLQGISAYRLGSDDEASRALTEAVRKSTGEDAARAQAALGLVSLRQGRNAEAATSLRAASRGLSGSDGKLAATWANRASAGAGGRRSVVAEGSGAFTIQVGAFHGRPRAESAARTAQELGERCGVAPVRIVTRSDDRGEPLFVVQMGSFGSRDEAADARRRVGNLQYIVATLVGG